MSGRPLSVPTWSRLWAGVLGALVVSLAFFPIYVGGSMTTGVLGQRLHLYADFEPALPFWPAMIVAYLSMFVLFLVPAFQLDAPWPNPTSRDVSFNLQLASAASVRVQVVDIAGRLVSLLMENRKLLPGTHHLRWNGRDDSGRPVGPGVYQVRISTGGLVRVRTMVMIK